MVEKVEVIPNDYEELKYHLENVCKELETLKRRPPKIEKIIEKVTVKPDDYDEMKEHIH